MFGAQVIRNLTRISRVPMTQTFQYSQQSLRWNHMETTTLQAKHTFVSSSSLAIQNLRQLLQKCKTETQLNQESCKGTKLKWRTL